MNIPECERVIYEYNPLIEVIAQLRFPTILKIASLCGWHYIVSALLSVTS